jgi:hypothetical protein
MELKTEGGGGGLLSRELRWGTVDGSYKSQPEDGILHSHCRENLKSYITLTGWTL